MADLVQDILASEHLPRVSPLVSEILSLLDDPEGVELDTVVALLAKLPGFEEAALSVINSAHFPLAREVRSLREAVVYLGMSNVCYLLIALLTKAMLPASQGRSEVFVRETYWRHCVGTSVASQKLAREVGRGDRYKLFTYGIVHDLGIAILDVCFPDRLDRLHQQLCRGPTLDDAEAECLDGTSHGEIGAAVFERWNVPADVCQAIRYHHHPDRLPEPVEDLDLLYVADAVSMSYYQRLLGAHPTSQLDRPVLKRVGVGRDTIDWLQQDFDLDVDAEIDMLHLDELEVLA